jgi:hypothetical protein
VVSFQDERCAELTRATLASLRLAFDLPSSVDEPVIRRRLLASLRHRDFAKVDMYVTSDRPSNASLAVVPCSGGQGPPDLQRQSCCGTRPRWTQGPSGWGLCRHLSTHAVSTAAIDLDPMTLDASGVIDYEEHIVEVRVEYPSVLPADHGVEVSVDFRDPLMDHPTGFASLLFQAEYPSDVGGLTRARKIDASGILQVGAFWLRVAEHPLIGAVGAAC